ncbi:MAG: 1-deoxy-D-xylulose-5-phosphate reductoisomerase [bacterium]|jgi:1-deoxy-D-xylulose-5-phosphate reductoisomerase
MKKKIVILGSTGSIGENAIRVAAVLPSRLKIIGIASNTSASRLLEQAAELHIKHVAIADPGIAAATRQSSPKNIRLYSGASGVEELAALPDADLVLCAMVGMAGLKPVLAALRQGTDVAIATKEVLVAAGGMVLDCARQNKARLLPVDSEHSAIFQCLEGKPASSIRRLILTASGGPFGSNRSIDFDKVTVAQALKHPRWNMGPKVSIDSATLMNKGLEIMEAHWLFGIPYDRIDVVIHPESIIHSMVEFVDGSILAQLSPPDMRFAIQHALTWPDREDGGLPRLDFATLGAMHFETPDLDRFPCLGLARKAAITGGTMPCVLNAANEIAVQAFLDNQITFAGIWHAVEAVMAHHNVIAKPTLDQIYTTDHWSRQEAKRVCLIAAKRKKA